jgi:hypothetical protein
MISTPQISVWRRSLLTDDTLRDELRAAFADDVSDMVPARSLVTAIKRRHRTYRRRTWTLRLLTPIVVGAAVAGLAAATPRSGRSADGAASAGRSEAAVLALTGTPVRLSGFTIPTPAHYTSSSSPCGLDSQPVHAAAKGSTACIQVLLESLSELDVPRSASWVLIGPYKAALVHVLGSPYTRLSVFFPEHPGIRVVVISARSVSTADLIAVAGKSVLSEP